MVDQEREREKRKKKEKILFLVRKEKEKEESSPDQAQVSISYGQNGMMMTMMQMGLATIDENDKWLSQYNLHQIPVVMATDALLYLWKHIKVFIGVVIHPLFLLFLLLYDTWMYHGARFASHNVLSIGFTHIHLLAVSFIRRSGCEGGWMMLGGSWGREARSRR